MFYASAITYQDSLGILAHSYYRRALNDLNLKIYS